MKENLNHITNGVRITSLTSQALNLSKKDYPAEEIMEDKLSPRSKSFLVCITGLYLYGVAIISFVHRAYISVKFRKPRDINLKTQTLKTKPFFFEMSVYYSILPKHYYYVTLLILLLWNTYISVRLAYEP